MIENQNTTAAYANRHITRRRHARSNAAIDFLSAVGTIIRIKNCFAGEHLASSFQKVFAYGAPLHAAMDHQTMPRFGGARRHRPSRVPIEETLQRFETIRF
jgi:hypothetical protein